MTIAETARSHFVEATKIMYLKEGGYYCLTQLVRGKWVKIQPLSLSEALHVKLASDEALEIVYPSVTKHGSQQTPHERTSDMASNSKSGKEVEVNKPKGNKITKLSTPQGVMADSIITKQWVGKDLVIESVERTTTGYGLAFIAQGHAPNSRKSESILIGASVLVKTIQGYLDQGGDFPIAVRTEKAPGKRYFVFAE